MDEYSNGTSHTALIIKAKNKTKFDLFIKQANATVNEIGRNWYHWEYVDEDSYKEEYHMSDLVKKRLVTFAIDVSDIHSAKVDFSILVTEVGVGIVISDIHL